MNEISLSIELEKIKIRDFLNQRISEYQNDLCDEGLTPQQYNILRGQIKELKNLISVLSLD